MQEIRDYLYEVVQNRELDIRHRMALVLASTHDLQSRITRSMLYEVDDLLANGAAGFLPKPHRIATMAAEIRRILDERKKSQPVPEEKSGKNLENPA